jgi:DNA-3-methyladenine glycosylase
MLREAARNAMKPCLERVGLSISIAAVGWMLNVVTGPIDYPAAVLITIDGIVGPARLTKALGITGELNGKVASKETSVWFSEGPRPPRKQIMRSARIGVDYAGSVWALKPYRFKLDHN